VGSRHSCQCAIMYDAMHGIEVIKLREARFSPSGFG
jgi:hypothetical protein